MAGNAERFRILIIDDDEEDFFITSEYIKNIEGQEFVLDWCYSYEEAFDIICSSKYDLYFVDYRLGAKTGLDLINDALKENCEDPIILLTGKGNKEIDIKAMEAGAVDYLVKTELNTEKLERCIRYALGRAHFIKALKANEQKFRNIFERSKDVVFIADEKLVFKDVNDATVELLGYTKDELSQLNLYSLLAEKKDTSEIKKAFKTRGELADKEVELLTRKNEKLSCILSFSKETDFNETVYVQGIIHDITYLKKVEKATLQAEKLKSAGRLVRTLAHEVRNPLNNINLSLEQLKTEVKNTDAGLYIDIISRNSKRIGDLISELLTSSLPAEIILEKKALQTIIDESIVAALDRITLKRIKLKLNYPDIPAYVMADAPKLKIAFLNIIINAVEAMKEDRGILIISLTTNSLYHTVSLSDTGAGITEENLSLLFEPYFTSKKNGLGLGLATTLNILQSHKALIDVQSQVDSGTTFTLTFERVDSNA